MRFLVFLIGMTCFGAVSIACADSDLQIHVAEKIERNLIVTADDMSVALYGVRLMDEEWNPQLYRSVQEYLRASLEPTSFKLDLTAFQQSGAGQNRYGDLQGKILLADGRWLQEQLIFQGYGLWSGAPSYPPALKERLIQAEKSAALEKLGLWRHFEIINANEPAEQFWHGQFIVAKGVVQEVYRRASVTYLNFGEDWRDDFTAAIPSRSRKKFEQDGWKLEDLKNRTVTVRGLVRFYNGPYLELDFPEQLEISEAEDKG